MARPKCKITDSFPIELVHKDFLAILQTAEQIHRQLPLNEAAAAVYAKAKASHHQENISVVQLYRDNML